MDTWLETSSRRVFARSAPTGRHRLELHAARGARVAFQVCLHTGDEAPLTQGCAVTAGDLSVRVRLVGSVPMARLTVDVPADEIDSLDFLPGLVPDPLLPGTGLWAGPHQTVAWWVTVDVPVDAKPGPVPVTITWPSSPDIGPSLDVVVHVHRAVLPARTGFPVTHWFSPDALCDHYGVDAFSDGFWRIVEPYLRNLREHGTDVAHVPLFTPPTDGDRGPHQLLDVTRTDDGYTFDWSLVERWIALVRSLGYTYVEWPHLFSPRIPLHPIRIFAGRGETHELLWEKTAESTGPAYREFLGDLLPQLEQFLRRNDLLDVSFFHESDEPIASISLEKYREVRGMLRELAPWMRVMDALSEPVFVTEGLTDIAVPQLNHVRPFADAGIPTWAYFCCSPRGRHVQRLLDTPLHKIRMIGATLHGTGVQGFLHWGYNHWYSLGADVPQLLDPFTESAAGQYPLIPAGDPFVVYPGKRGPIDSIRWEAFAAGLQDLALLRGAGIATDGPEMAEVKDFAEWPRDPQWLDDLHRTALDRLVD
jgi:hypothetical protein